MAEVFWITAHVYYGIHQPAEQKGKSPCTHPGAEALQRLVVYAVLIWRQVLDGHVEG